MSIVNCYNKGNSLLLGLKQKKIVYLKWQIHERGNLGNFVLLQNTGKYFSHKKNYEYFLFLYTTQNSSLDLLMGDSSVDKLNKLWGIQASIWVLFD